MELMKVKLDEFAYEEAANKGMQFEEWLEKFMVEDKHAEPTEYFKTGMISNAQRTRLASQFIKEGKQKPASALENLFLSYGIKAFGDHTDPVNKVFNLSDSAVLFPAFLSNRIYAGLIQAAPLDEFLATTQVITGTSFRKVYMQDTADQRSTKRGAKGAEAPLVRIVVADQSIALKKHWLRFELNYEDVNDQPLGLMAILMMRIGKQLGYNRFDDLTYVIVNGDGNSNGLESDQTKNVVTTTEIRKTDIITFMAALPAAYTLTRGVATTTEWVKFVDALSDMTNPSGQKAEVGVPFPKVTRWDGYMGGVTDRIFGVDASTAIGYVTNDTAVLTETDKIIRRQVTETVVSERGAFDVIDQDAIGCLDVTT